MEPIFDKLKHFFGLCAMAVVSLVHKTDQVVDAEVPEIDALLEKGASVANLIPGIGPKVALLLNGGVQLLGDVKASIDAADAVLTKAEEQAQEMAPLGYSFVLIKSDVKADIAELFKTFEAEYSAAKATVSTLHAPSSGTVNAAATPEDAGTDG